MLYSADHATNGRSIFQGPDAVHLVQSETDQRLTLHSRTANGATDLFDRNRLAFIF